MIVQPREFDAHDDEFNLFAVKYWSSWITSGTKKGKLNFKFWRYDDEFLETHSDTTNDGKSLNLVPRDGRVEKEETYETYSMFSKQSVRAIILHSFRKWHKRLSFIWKHGARFLRTLWVCVLDNVVVIFPLPLSIFKLIPLYILNFYLN